MQYRQQQRGLWVGVLVFVIPAVAIGGCGGSSSSGAAKDPAPAVAKFCDDARALSNANDALSHGDPAHPEQRIPEFHALGVAARALDQDVPPSIASDLDVLARVVPKPFASADQRDAAVKVVDSYLAENCALHFSFAQFDLHAALQEQ